MGSLPEELRTTPAQSADSESKLSLPQTGEEDLSVWITDDDNRIPVLFEAPILVGVASGRITDWSGLKHPFSALMKK